MREEERLNEMEREAEAALSALRPARPAFDVQRVAIEAARRSALRQVWLWRGIAAALGTGLVLALVLRPSPRTVEKYVYIPPPEAVPQQVAQRPVRSEVAPTIPFELLTRGGTDYLSIRDDVLVLGVRGLPRLRPDDATLPRADRVEELKLQDMGPNPSGMFKFLNWM
jgi:hypothetical protein